MNTDYKNELDKSYLILDGIAQAPEFILNMQIENHIHGLLDATKRSFNGEERMYYDISGQQTLVSLSQTRLLNDQDLKGLFGELLLTLESLNLYFLDPAGILLDFEHIYVSPQGCHFCYYPIPGDYIEKKMARFGEELLGYVDHNNEKAVVLAYQFYRMVKDSHKMARQILHEIMEEPEEMEVEEAADREPGIQADSNQECSEDISFSGEQKENSFVQLLKEDILSIGIFFLLFSGSTGYFIYRYFLTGNTNLLAETATRNGIVAAAFFFLSLVGMAGTVFLNWKKLHRKADSHH